MICKNCGAEMGTAPDKCPLCGAPVDKEGLFREFSEKGDGYFFTGDYGRAAAFYQEALDTGHPADTEIYIKYGTALDKKNDRRAAAMYLRAISADFYNERAHALLITCYDSHNKLPELKKWYEKSGAGYDAGFVEKQVKIIDAMINFRANPSVTVPDKVSAAPAGLIKAAGGWFKRYIIINIVLSVVFLILAAGAAMFYFLKVNIIFSAAICVVFLRAGAPVVLWIRRRRARDAKNKTARLQEILDEFKGDK